MLRSIKNIAILLVLFSLPLAGKYYLASPEERQFYLDWAQSRLQPLRENIGQLQRRTLSTGAFQVAENFSQGEVFQQIPSCGKTETLAVQNVDSAAVYRWEDDNGQVHFSDQAPGKSRKSEKMSVHYRDKKRYFNLKILEDTASLPAFTHDRVSADVRQIYGILSRDLELEHLRQVNLNVRIIEDQAGFQDYKNRVAPQIRTNSGFYTSKNNEAVVFQGNNPDAMRAVVRHEASHVIMAGLYGFTPTWFNEGMAEYFEQLEVDGQARVIRPASYHLEHLRGMLKREDAFDLKSYIALPASDWYAGNLRDHYALAWSLVYFLMSDGEGKKVLRTLMNSFAQDYCGGLLVDGYFDEHYPGGLAALENNWRSRLFAGQVLAHRY